MIKTAQYFDTLDNDVVVCRLCPANCRLTKGKRGICKCRYNQDGKLVTDNYGELVTIAIDPIEKKPLYHYYPSKDILSTGANGCNFGCVHCQNWTISQEKVKTMYVAPEDLVETALQHQSIGVAFTYTEPLIWYEYIADTAPLLKEKDLKVILVTNGYINAEPLSHLIGYVDAANIDLKGMRPDFYKRMCKGKLQPILDNIHTFAEAGVHLELTNLIIPGANDSAGDINALIDFVASISDSIPLHFSAYHPDYKFTAPPTPIETMLSAREAAMKRLKYVYLGNVAISDGSDTICPECNNLLVKRDRYFTSVKGLQGGCCSECGFDTGIVQ